MEHSIVDVLIERIDTHPDEFFNAQILMQTFNIVGAIERGIKWPKLVKYVLDGDTSLFSEAEKTRFRNKLNKKMREAIDVETMKTITDPARTFGNEVIPVQTPKQAPPAQTTTWRYHQDVQQDEHEFEAIKRFEIERAKQLYWEEQKARKIWAQPPEKNIRKK